MNKTIKIFLSLILVLSFSLRLIGLGNNPPSLNWDEVSHGYNAFSILKTGHDEWGQFMPITNFRAYGDYPTTLYMYLLMPIISTFGLNEITLRLPSAILGSLLSLVIFFLAQKILKKDWISLIAALIVSLSPWSILLSRQALQATPAVFFMALGILAFLQGIKGNKIWSLIGTLLLGLSAYGYHNTRIYSPVLLLILLITYRKTLLKNTKYLLLIIISAVILFTPVFFAVISSQGNARSAWVGILDQGAINKINESRGKSTLSPVLAKLVHNKATYFSKVASQNFIGYFSPHFLALNGGSHYQFSVQGFGVINPVELPFFYLGLFYLLFRFSKRSKEERFLLFWLLTSPLPAIITRDPYQVVRVTTMMPAVFLTTAFGLKVFFDFLSSRRKKIFILVSVLVWSLYLFSTIKYLKELWYVYPVDNSQSWQFGYKEVINYAEANRDIYTKILMTKRYGEPHEFVLFYTSYDPAKYIKDPNLVRYEKSNWFWTDSFDKYIFINDWEVKEKSKQFSGALLITSPSNFPENSQLIKTINFLNGEPAFDIVKIL